MPSSIKPIEYSSSSPSVGLMDNGLNSDNDNDQLEKKKRKEVINDDDHPIQSSVPLHSSNLDTERSGLTSTLDHINNNKKKKKKSKLRKKKKVLETL